MNGKKLKFIFLLTLVAVLVYLAGEVLLFVLENNSPLISVLWLALVLAGTLGISLWKCPRDYDKNE